MTPEPSRRSFLSFAVFGLGAIFTAILGVPVVLYLLDPLNRKGKQSNLKLVEGVRLDELSLRNPVQGVIRDTRRDGWILYPNDVVGRVWVVKVGDRPTLDLLVFTTICPHLGCSVNFAAGSFVCPCHAATFAVDGARTGTGNPAARNMDTLEWAIDPEDPNRLLVRYENFRASSDKKLPA